MRIRGNGQKLVCFFFKSLGLLLLFVVVNHLVFKLLTPYYWGNEQFDRKITFLNNHKEEFNTLFVGSSHVGRGIIPEVFDSIINSRFSESVSSFNFASARLLPPESYYLYEYMIENESFSDNLKVVFFELAPVDLIVDIHYLHTRRLYYWYTPSYFIFTLNAVLHAKVPLMKKLYGLFMHITSFVEQQFFNGSLDQIIAFYHEENEMTDEVKARKGFFSSGHITDTTSVFYIKHHEFLSDPQKLFERKDRVAEKDFYPEKPHGYNRVHVDKLFDLIELSEEHGIKLIFVLMPRLLSNEYDRSIQLCSMLGPDHCIQLADPVQYPELWSLESSFDFNHLNESGARLFTKLLAERFIEIQHRSKE